MCVTVSSNEFKLLGLEAVETTKNVFRIDTADGAVMYYARSARWQHRGRTHNGTVEDMHHWMTQKNLITLEV